MEEELTVNNNASMSMSIDRLSSLPNDILLKILSLLPLTTAASTSTLSSRWAHIWTHLSHLRLDGPTFTSLSNSTIVNRIFNQLTSPQIHSFEFCLYGLFNNEDLQEQQQQLLSTALHCWVPQICARNPINFEVFYLHFTDEFNISAPYCVFETTSLVTLKVTGLLSFDNLPQTQSESGFVNLPNLKELTLSCITLPPQLLTALCKSCPKLEVLHLGLKLQEAQILQIIAPNLKSLSLHMHLSPQSCVFVIDAPLLEDIVMCCNASYCYLVKKFSLLSKAKIDLGRLIFGQGNEIDDYLKNVVEFFQGMSSVKSLELNYILMFDGLNQVDKSLWSGFHNLIHLRLWVYKGYEVNWDAPIPLCLLGKLTKLDYSFERETDHDNHVKVARYILSNANVLEQLNIYRHFSLSLEDENEALLQEFELCSKIFVLSRKSLACQIEFKGNSICGSSDRAGTGLIVPRIESLHLED